MSHKYNRNNFRRQCESEKNAVATAESFLRVYSVVQSSKKKMFTFNAYEQYVKYM